MLGSIAEIGIGPSLFGARDQPSIDVWPGVFAGTAARHDSDVATGNPEQFPVLAADLRHDGLRLTRRGDVITLGDDRQQIGSYLTPVPPVAAGYQLPPHQ